MSYVPHVNEIDVFQAVRLGNWAELASALAEHSKRSLHEYKTHVLDKRCARRDREQKAEMLLLPMYPMLGVFHMQHEEGSKKLLEALNKDTYVRRMDASKLVMHLVETNINGLIWSLQAGWGEQLGLLQSRQHTMDWQKLQAALKTESDRETVDGWMRKWAKRNPLILKELGSPSLNECRTLLVDHLYVSSKELNVFMTDDSFRGFFQTVEGLGLWGNSTTVLTMKQKASILRPHFTQEPVAQLSLPDDLLVEP